MNHVTLTAAKIAEMVNGKLIGSPDRTISSVSGIRDAQSDQLSFIGNKKYQHQLESTKAGVVLVCPDLADAPAVDRSLIVCDNVDYAFAKVIAVFAEEPPKWPVGVHPSAVVSPEAKLGQGVSINANAVIEAGAEIGDGTVIGAGCYIGHDVKIGAGSLLYPNVTVMYRCVIGRKAVIHPGVVIGGDGFGFIPTKQGLVKVPQTGIVQIDDDVANLVVAQLLFLQAEDPKKDIDLYINSPGGSVTAGLAIYDTMQILSCDVKTYCVGQCASMGAVLLCAGAAGKRFALPNSRIMIHQPWGGMQGTAADIDIQAKEILRLKAMLNSIIANHSGQSIKKIEKDTERDFFMGAEEAVKYGLVDKVVSRPSAEK